MGGQKASSRGFTLTELLMVVVILGILASMAIPGYRKTVERGYYREAQDLLLTLYSGERSYLFRENAYKDLNPTSPQSDWREIYMDNPNLGSIPVQFDVTAVNNASNPRTFTAEAKRMGGICNNKTITIDQDRTFVPNPPGACWQGCNC